MEIGSEFKNPVLHVVVVAFHHKKGCQVMMLRFCCSALSSYRCKAIVSERFAKLNFSTENVDMMS